MARQKPEFIVVPFGKIRPWGKNPRQIEPEKLRALARSVEKYGLFQNLTCWMEDGEYVTGGGNMRYRAMKEILKYGDDHPIQISVNYPETEAEKLELSFLDNQTFGFYNELEVAELIKPFESLLDLDFLSVDIHKPLDLATVLDNYRMEEGDIPMVDLDDGGPSITNRMPISTDVVVVGVGRYVSIVKRAVAEPIVDMLEAKWGLTREGRMEAALWICSLLSEKLQSMGLQAKTMTTEERIENDRKHIRSFRTKRAEDAVKRSKEREEKFGEERGKHAAVEEQEPVVEERKEPE